MYTQNVGNVTERISGVLAIGVGVVWEGLYYYGWLFFSNGSAFLFLITRFHDSFDTEYPFMLK